jgi:hypothetical protein
VLTNPARTERWKALDFGPPPSDVAEPDSPVLVEYLFGERVALITLNRPHADNAITTELGARLTESSRRSRSDAADRTGRTELLMMNRRVTLMA